MEHGNEAERASDGGPDDENHRSGDDVLEVKAMDHEDDDEDNNN